MSSVRENPEETHIFAILYPAKGKLERVRVPLLNRTWETQYSTDDRIQLKELMAVHINATHANEDYTPRYLMTEQLDTDEPALHMFETYTSRDGADRHTKTANFKQLMVDCEKEGIMGKEPYLVFTKTVGGYDWDRKKI